MNDPWHIDRIFRTQTIFGSEGSGRNLDHKKLLLIGEHIAKLRGIIIHEVTSLEDQIEATILTGSDSSKLFDAIAAYHLRSIRDSFERKKQLLKKVVGQFTSHKITEKEFDDLNWLQTLRNDFAHGAERVHSSYDYAEIQHKGRTYTLPDHKLIHRFHVVLAEWHDILEPNLSIQSR